MFSIDMGQDKELNTLSRTKPDKTKIDVQPRGRRLDSKASVTSSTIDGEPPVATAMDSFVM